MKILGQDLVTPTELAAIEAKLKQELLAHRVLMGVLALVLLVKVIHG